MLLIVLAVLIFLLGSIIVGSFIVTELMKGHVDHVPTEGFSEINSDVLEKITTFDSELGWERRPNEQKENYRGGSFTIDDRGSRTCINGRECDEFSVATYGDSFCFCNQVNDEETFQNYLAKELNIHVSNYGVGNYGIDQALLRLKRRFENDPADVVVLVAYPGTISRICGMWRHYSDFGKVYNLSPRFEIEGDELSLYPIPIDKKAEFLELDSYSDYLQNHDYHYQHWFRRHRWPNIILTTFSDRRKIRYATWSGLNYLEKKVGYTIPKLKTEQRQKKSRKAISPDPEKINYIRNLYDEHQDLYCALIGKFVQYTLQKGASPIFMPLNYKKYENYRINNGEQIDEDILTRLKQEYPELIVCDPRKQLSKSAECLDELYIEHGSGHHSAKANKLIGEILAEEIKSIKKEADRL